ncbi:hypothetical protein F0562_019793 [Nyssa sinensis]|uniref:Aspergillus nuclease S1 n=1 Tax=Nyssa sinensis TaxID=561372 RepID=A0A5J5BSF0_9ASTE|nr:hypothetical protein F0562_019793 [Nyssa sinensis]
MDLVRASVNDNLNEALLFLSHFMGDIHQPLHVGFTSDEGGNTIDLRWFGHKSNLHHVWDREIILTAVADYYEKDMDLLQKDIEGNFTDGIWSDDFASWEDCDDLITCVNKFAAESINLACKWGYKGVESGQTLAGIGYLEDRKKPIILSMARIDTVKNITGLTEWYGKNKRLRNLVNLVVVAGFFDPTKSKDREEMVEIKKMHTLIDKYQLKGQIRWIAA